MLTTIRKKHTFGSLEGLGDDTTISRVVTFVEKHLVDFSNQYQTFSDSPISNEKGLTQVLCILLNRYAREESYPFQFEKEYMEEVERGDSPQVDIGVIYHETTPETIETTYYTGGGAFFAMEAKRLDTLSTAREKEYLVGRQTKDKYLNCGGVERFKNETHGKRLNSAGVIGYVQQYDFDYWYHLINSWIDELIAGKILSPVTWSATDKLMAETKHPKTAQYKSENSRTTGRNILLFHLWVNLIQSSN